MIHFTVAWRIMWVKMYKLIITCPVYIIGACKMEADSGQEV